MPDGGHFHGNSSEMDRQRPEAADAQTSSARRPQALQVEWAGGDIAPGEAVKAKFYLRRAFLYGFEFCSAESR